MTTFRSALIIDDDQTIRSYLEELLRDFGVETVAIASDGQEGWEAAVSRNFDLIVTDWKLPRTNGLTLVNRLRRSQQYPHVPIIVMSGFLGRKDFKLLDELTLTEKIEKPFSSSGFLEKVAAVEKEYAWHEEKKGELMALMREGGQGMPHFTAKMKEILQGAPNPLPALLLGTRLLFRMEDYAGAEQLMKLALKIRPGAVLPLFELGKIYMKQKRYDEALPLLEKAQMLSPDNMSRLCLLGNAHLQQMNPDKARESFKQALRIDAEDKVAQHGMNVAENMGDYMTDMSPEQRLGASFASMMNAVGIAMVRQGKIDEGINHYKSAMVYVEDKESRAKLAFNSALGCIRKKDYGGAKGWLDTALAIHANYPKAETLMARVDEATSRGAAPDLGGDWQEGYEVIPSGLEATVARTPDLAGPADILVDPAVAVEDSNLLPLRRGPESSVPAKDPKDIRRALLAQCPHAKEIFKMLTSSGVNSLSQMPDFHRLLERYGAQMLDKAFLQAIKERNPKAAFIESALAQLAG